MKATQRQDRRVSDWDPRQIRTMHAARRFLSSTLISFYTYPDDKSTSQLSIEGPSEGGCPIQHNVNTYPTTLIITQPASVSPLFPKAFPTLLTPLFSYLLNANPNNPSICTHTLPHLFKYPSTTPLQVPNLSRFHSATAFSLSFSSPPAFKISFPSTSHRPR